MSHRAELIRCIDMSGAGGKDILTESSRVLYESSNVNASKLQRRTTFNEARAEYPVAAERF
jgi:hypothetical protein